MLSSEYGKEVSAMKQSDWVSDWLIALSVLVMAVFVFADASLNPPSAEEIVARNEASEKWAEAHPYCADHLQDICTDGLLDSAASLFNGLMPTFLLITGVSLALGLFQLWRERWKRRKLQVKEGGDHGVQKEG
jgi:hypothetical protein